MAPAVLIDASCAESHLRLTSLPDELIAMCYAGLPATDLVTLEHVSSRLRDLIATDSLCWKRCVETRWAKMLANPVILPAAARHAGSWKALYAEKAAMDVKHGSWLVISAAETKAVVDVVAAIDRSGSSMRVPRHSPWHAGGDPEAAGTGSGTANGTRNDDGDRIMEPSSPPTQGISPLGDSMSITTDAASPVSVMQPPRSLSVVVLVDASSSVTDDDFTIMKSFTTSLAIALRETDADAQMALIQFNQHPRVELSLTAVSKPRVLAAIGGMDQLMGSTDIAAPIRRARQMLADEAPPAADHVIVLLTDGQTHADELHESEREARKAAEEVSARIYTLGVGRDIDEAGLARVAGGSPGGMYFTVRRFVHTK